MSTCEHKETIADRDNDDVIVCKQCGSRTEVGIGWLNSYVVFDVDASGEPINHINSFIRILVAYSPADAANKWSVFYHNKYGKDYLGHIKVIPNSLAEMFQTEQIVTIAPCKKG